MNRRFEIYSLQMSATNLKTQTCKKRTKRRLSRDLCKFTLITRSRTAIEALTCRLLLGVEDTADVQQLKTKGKKNGENNGYNRFV